MCMSAYRSLQKMSFVLFSIFISLSCSIHCESSEFGYNIKVPQSWYYRSFEIDDGACQSLWFPLEFGRFGYNGRCPMFRFFRQKKSDVRFRCRCSAYTAACPVVHLVRPLVSFALFAGGGGRIVVAAVGAVSRKP